MPPKRTRPSRAAATKAAAPVAKAADVKAPALPSRKRKADDADAQEAPAKRAKSSDAKDDVKKKPAAKKPATKKQPAATKPAAKKTIEKKTIPRKTAPKKTLAKASVASPSPEVSFSIEPETTLAAFQASAPDTSSLPVINQAPTEVLTIFVFGTGDMSGDLGLGPKKKVAKLPTAIPNLDARKPDTYRVVQLDCGGMHTLALTADNKIVTWGGNDEGALGRDTAWEGGMRDMEAEPKDDSDSDDSDDEGLNPLESTPTHIPEDAFPAGTKFTHVAAGDSCSFAVTDKGLVYGWGTFADSEAKKTFLYYKGEKIEKQTKPMLMPGLRDITTIKCGANHALALDKKGRVWTWGINEKLQVGRRLHPENEYMDNFYPGVLDLSRHGVKLITAGPYHSLAVDNKDKVFAWGLNNFGQAGYNKNAGADDARLPYPLEVRSLSKKKIQVIDAGERQSAAVTADGHCLVWGAVGEWNGFELTQEQIDNPKVIFKTESGRPGIILQPIAVPQIGEAAYVACSATHTIFLNKQGKAFASGFGEEGQLGNKEMEDNKTAQPVAKVDSINVTWAGTGGQWSMIGSPLPLSNGTA